MQKQRDEAFQKIFDIIVTNVVNADRKMFMEGLDRGSFTGSQTDLKETDLDTIVDRVLWKWANERPTLGFSKEDWLSWPIESTSQLLWLACDTRNAKMAAKLVHLVGEEDETRSDGTTAVHMAFGHQCVELIELFLGSLPWNESIKREAKSIALSIIDDDDASKALKSTIKRYLPEMPRSDPDNQEYQLTR